MQEVFAAYQWKVADKRTGKGFRERTWFASVTLISAVGASPIGTKYTLRDSRQPEVTSETNPVTRKRKKSAWNDFRLDRSVDVTGSAPYGLRRIGAGQIGASFERHQFGKVVGRDSRAEEYTEKISKVRHKKPSHEMNALLKSRRLSNLIRGQYKNFFVGNK